MIGSLRGVLLEQPKVDKGSAEVLLEVAGIGYRLTVTAGTLQRMQVGEESFLYVHHHFWEADQKLFGFATRDERDAFEGLLGAHKVGPALALAVIATYPPAELARVLATDDVDALCEVPGVGKKTAQRLLVDLKSVLVLPVLDTEDGQPIDLTEAGAATEVLTDVRQALDALGYGPEEIQRAIKALDPTEVAAAADGGGSGALLKKALRTLAAG
ncbi:MAG: Holliday junction branch migration protein RuvA [Acidimicrobiales bacterium]